MRRRSFLRTAAAGLGMVAGVPGLAAGGESSDRLVWRYETGDDVDSSPTVVDGTVYVGSDDRRLYAIDAGTGQREWAKKFDSAVETSPAVTEGAVFAISGGLRALDPDSGEDQQIVASIPRIDASLTVANGRVFVADVNGGLTAFDPADGSELWTAATGSDSIMQPPVSAGGSVYVTGWKAVAAFDAATGGEQWRFERGNRYRGAPTVADGTVFVSTNDERFHALDGGTGEQQWAADIGATSTPTVFDGTVYVVDGELYALDASTGTIEWRNADGRFRSAPTVADGVVFVGGEGRVSAREERSSSSVEGNHVYGIDATTGELLWRYRVDGPVESAPTVVDGTLFVGSRDSRIYALDAGVDGSSEGSRVRLGTHGHHHSQVDGATGTVTVPEDLSLSFAPSVQTCSPDGQVEVGLWVTEAPRGVGSVSASIRIRPDLQSGGLAARIADAAVVPDADSVRAEIEDGGNRLDVEVGGIAPDRGPLLELELAGVERAHASLQVSDVTVEAQDGTPYERVTSADATVFCSGTDLHWRADLSSDAIRSSPTVVDGTLFVGDVTGTVFAVDPETGDEQWRVETDGPITSAVTVVDGTAYVPSDDVYALDAETGEQRWRARVNGRINTTLRVHDGTVYVPAEDLHALDAGTGDREWTVETVEAIEAPPLLAAAVDDQGPLVLVEPHIRRLYGIDAETGAKRLELDTPRFGTFAIDDGTLVAGAPTARAMTLDGDHRWSTEVTEPNPWFRYLPPTLDGDTVLLANDVSNSSGTLTAFADDTGEELWSAELDEVRAPPTSAGGIVYVGAFGVSAFDVETGEQRWQFPTEGTQTFSPTVVDGTLFVGDSAGYLYALDAGVDGSSDDLLTRRRLSGHHDGGPIDAVRPRSDVEPERGTDEDAGVDSEGETDEDAGVDSEGETDDGSESGGNSDGGTGNEGGSVDEGTSAADGTDRAGRNDTEGIESDDGSGPGFDVGGTLATLGGTGYLLKRRIDSNDSET